LAFKSAAHLEIFKIIELMKQIFWSQCVFIEIAVVTRQNMLVVCVGTVFVSGSELFSIVIGTSDILPQKQLLANVAYNKISIHGSKSQSFPIVGDKRKLLPVIKFLSNYTL